MRWQQLILELREVLEDGDCRQFVDMRTGTLYGKKKKPGAKGCRPAYYVPGSLARLGIPAAAKTTPIGTTTSANVTGGGTL